MVERGRGSVIMSAGIRRRAWTPVIADPGKKTAATFPLRASMLMYTTADADSCEPFGARITRGRSIRS